MGEEVRRVPSAWPPLLALAALSGLAIALLVVDLIIEHRTAANTSELVDNSLQSVALAADLGIQARHLAATRAPADVAAIVGHLADDARRYDPLTTFPGEREEWLRLQQLLARLQAGDTADALVDAIEDSSNRLVAINTAEAEASVDAISHDHHNATTLGVLEVCAILVLAAVVAVFLVRALRRQHELVHRHVELLAARAEASIRASGARLLEAEAELRQAQKMEAIGRLAGGVAHDFNNLLSVILSYAELLLEDLPIRAPMRGELEEIHRAGRSASALTRQLLAFSRRQMLQPRVIELTQVVRGMEQMLQRLLGEHIEISLRANAADDRVYADPAQVEQIVLNLAVNARDAMPDGGALVLETSTLELDESQPGVARGSYVVLAVTDSGVGMTAETRERMFEPFFTTKDVGKGTGLGLSTVFGIVKQSNGSITVDSEPGRGTTLKIYLPHTDRVPEARAVIAAVTTLRGAETILVVEDNDEVRGMIQRVLRRSGYEVLEAQNGGEAILACERHSAPIDLLLTDVVMPRMSGREVAARLAKIKPDMRTLFVSGYTDDAIPGVAALADGVAFLHKPLTPDALLHKVREVLSAR